MKKIAIILGTVLVCTTVIVTPTILFYYNNNNKKPDPTPPVDYTMDIDAYKTFHTPGRSEFTWSGTGVWVEEYLNADTQINFKSSKISDPDNFIRFNGISVKDVSKWNNIKDIGFILDEARAIGGYPPYLGFEWIFCNNIYISISDPAFYEKSFYNWTTTGNSYKMFEQTENICIYLEIDSNLAKISDPEDTWIKQFYNTNKIKEFVIKDVATEKLTNKTIWNNKFKLDDINKIFLI